MFRALLACPQEALHKLDILRACYISWLDQDWSGTGVRDTSSTPIHRSLSISLYRLSQPGPQLHAYSFEASLTWF
jgi:hypothetical protein